MMAMILAPRQAARSCIARHQTRGLVAFTVIVILHWLEHLVQAFQIYALGWPTAEARGILGIPFPWLIRSEVMHYGYAVVMLAGIWLLRGAFTPPARQWWMLALGLQVWHHFEHLLLLTQATSGRTLDGGPVPVSLLQLFVPRVELHLFYNTMVTIPMVVAMALEFGHRRRAACTLVAEQRA